MKRFFIQLNSIQKKMLFSLTLFLRGSFLFADDASILKEELDVFAKEHLKLVQFSAEEMGHLANQWGKHMAKILHVPEEIQEIDPSVVEKVIALLNNNESKIFMRHGSQQQSEETCAQPLKVQKIEMMRLPNNWLDSLTPASMAEWIEAVIVWEYVRQKTGLHFTVESSENRRAELPASALAHALKTDVQLNSELNCVNYPSNEQMTIEEILEWLPDGTLPWDQETVDAVIGPETYKCVTHDKKNV